MKFVKMLGLAMVAAVAAMAFLGASSAMAVHLPVLCKVNPETGKLCPAGSLYKKGTILKGELEKLKNAKGEEQLHAVLLGSLFSELCEKSSFEGEITQTSPIHGLLNTLTFTECTPCPTVTIEHLPYLVTVTHDEEPGVHLWLLKFTTSGVGNPRVRISGGICGGTGCTFEATLVHLDAENKAETPLVLTLENQLTTIAPCVAGGTGTVGKWDANYLITSPKPSYLALDEKEEA